jgi:hypothetical protein
MYVCMHTHTHTHIHMHMNRFRCSNTIAFDATGEHMYFCDTPTKKIYRFKYSPTGSLSEKVVHIRVYIYIYIYIYILRAYAYTHTHARRETIMYSSACSITHSDGRSVALYKRGDSESCSVAFALQSTRSCNASCSPTLRSALCRQNLGDDTDDCMATCWSSCSGACLMMSVCMCVCACVCVCVCVNTDM